MYEVCESICHECTSKDAVKIYIEDIVVEMKELFIKKVMENNKIMRERKNMKINSPQYEIEF